MGYNPTHQSRFTIDDWRPSVSEKNRGRVTQPGRLARWGGVVRAEAAQIQGFMQILMKPRNGGSWSPEDRAALRHHLQRLARALALLHHLKRLARALPVLGIFALPGGSLLLPLLAVALDRRKKRRSARAAALAQSSAMSSAAGYGAASAGPANENNSLPLRAKS